MARRPRVAGGFVVREALRQAVERAWADVGTALPDWAALWTRLRNESSSLHQSKFGGLPGTRRRAARTRAHHEDDGADREADDCSTVTHRRAIARL